jgi:hypothetical protein
MMKTEADLLVDINRKIVEDNERADEGDWIIVDEFQTIKAFMQDAFKHIAANPSDLNDSAWKQILVDVCAFIAKQHAVYKADVFQQWVQWVDGNVGIEDVIKRGPRLLALTKACEFTGIILQIESLYDRLNIDKPRLLMSSQHRVLVDIHRVIYHALNKVAMPHETLDRWVEDLRFMPMAQDTWESLSKAPETWVDDADKCTIMLLNVMVRTDNVSAVDTVLSELRSRNTLGTLMKEIQSAYPDIVTQHPYLTRFESAFREQPIPSACSMRISTFLYHLVTTGAPLTWSWPSIQSTIVSHTAGGQIPKVKKE